MSLLKNLTTSADIKSDTDSVGGSNYGPLDSALYKSTVTMAHLSESAGGAAALVLSMKTEDNQEFRQTLWMSSGRDKGGKNYYEKDGEKSYLPGFIHATSLCLLTVGKEVADMETETKVIKLYSPEARTEVPTKVDVVVDLVGKEIIVGLIRQTVDKNKKNEKTGVYEPTGETREENEVDKFFRAKDRMTTAEIRAQAEEAAFANTWEAKWAGKVRNKAKGGAATGTAGAPKASGAATVKKPATSLFA